MAWILAPIAAYGILSSVDDYIDEKMKPIYDYFDKSAIDDIQRGIS